MTSEESNEVKHEETTETRANEINEEATEEIKTEQNEEVSQPKEQTIPIAKAKPKAVPKKLARTVKVVELVECGACNKKMLPKSLRNTHPSYCKGQPTESLPVNRHKASYGTKVAQKLRKEIQEEIKKNMKPKKLRYTNPLKQKQNRSRVCQVCQVCQSN